MPAIWFGTWYGLTSGTIAPPVVPDPPEGDILSRGMSWLTDQLSTHVSTSITYRRDLESITVGATFGRTLLKLEDDYGAIRMEWTDRDFLVPAAALVLGGSAAVPLRGDLIRETRGATTFVYEVMAPGKEPVWKWTDPFRNMRRIHTKLVATEGD
jgi:hypothetical protein